MTKITVRDNEGHDITPLENLDDLESMLDSIVKEALKSSNSSYTKMLMQAMGTNSVSGLRIRLNDCKHVMEAAKKARLEEFKHRDIVDKVLDYIDKRDFKSVSEKSIRHKLAAIALALSVGLFATGQRDGQSIMFGIGAGALLPDIIQKWKES